MAEEEIRSPVPLVKQEQVQQKRNGEEVAPTPKTWDRRNNVSALWEQHREHCQQKKQPIHNAQDSYSMYSATPVVLVPLRSVRGIESIPAAER